MIDFLILWKSSYVKKPLEDKSAITEFSSNIRIPISIPEWLWRCLSACASDKSAVESSVTYKKAINVAPTLSSSFKFKPKDNSQNVKSGLRLDQHNHLDGLVTNTQRAFVSHVIINSYVKVKHPFIKLIIPFALSADQWNEMKKTKTKQQRKEIYLV